MQVGWRYGKEFGSRERENVLGLSFVVDVGKAVMWWNSETNVGRVALCWKLDFVVETIVKLRHRFSCRSRTENSRKSVKVFFFLDAFCFRKSVGFVGRT